MSYAVDESVGDVAFEALDGFLELAHLRVLEGDVGGEKFVEGLVLRERCLQHLPTVLVENGALRILEEDIRVRVAFVEFLGDLDFEVVVGVLALPKPVVEAEDIFQRAVRRHALFAAGIVVVQFLDQQEIARTGVGVDEIEDGPADRGSLELPP